MSLTSPTVEQAKLKEAEESAPPPVQAEPISQRRAELTSQLRESVAQAQQVYEQTASKIGIRAPQMGASFASSAFKIGKRVIGKNEVKRIDAIQKEAVNRWVNKLDLRNNTERTYAMSILNQRIFKKRAALMANAMEFKKKLAQSTADRKEQERIQQLYGQLIGTVTQGIFSR